MLDQISQEIKQLISNYNSTDKLIFRNKHIDIDLNSFQQIHSQENNKSITFIDGGQAEIFNAGSFCLSFIRVAAVRFRDNKKEKLIKNDFYLLTYTKNFNNDIFYFSKIFPLNNSQPLIQEDQLTISSNDKTIKDGINRAPIQKVINMARRFAELNLTKKLADENFSDYFVLDGTLEPSFNNENQLIFQLPNNVSALAKSSSLFTEKGNNPNSLLSKLSPLSVWSYNLYDNNFFVKLHSKSKHVFRFEGDKNIISALVSNCNDPLFFGYPYGLIFVDLMARVSNQEKESLKMSFLLNKKNKEIIQYLNIGNAHEILDNIY